MTAPTTRDALLEQAFSEIPSRIGKLELRPLSAGSFTLLSRLGNPMMTGSANPEETKDQSAMFLAVIQYVWVHSAPLDAVRRVLSVDDIPAGELQELQWQVTLPEIMAFLQGYTRSANRMAASLAEDDEGEDSGKAEGSPRAGLQVFSTDSEQQATPSESDTSSGTCQSSEPSVISTLPTSPTEQAADGVVTFPSPTTEPTPQSKSMQRSRLDGNPDLSRPVGHPLLHFGKGFRKRLPEGWTLKERNHDWAMAISPDGQEYYLSDEAAYPRRIAESYVGSLKPGDPYVDADEGVVPLPTD